MESVWVWDAARSKYYYYESSSQTYVYEDGERISVPSSHARDTSDDSVTSVTSTFSIDSQTTIQHPQVQHQDESDTLSSSTLDSRFYARNRDFYSVGKVFRACLPGDPRYTRYGYTTTPPELRLFVVVGKGANNCTCLPIRNFVDGTTDESLFDHRAIVYTRAHYVPQPSYSESHNSRPMRLLGVPIRLVAISPLDTVDPGARIYFSQVYMVGLDVKVEEFGSVDRPDMDKLIQEFSSHWDRPYSQSVRAVPSSQNTYPKELYLPIRRTTLRSDQRTVVSRVDQSDYDDMDEERARVSDYIFDQETFSQASPNTDHSTGNGKGKGSQGSMGVSTYPPRAQPPPTYYEDPTGYQEPY